MKFSDFTSQSIRSFLLLCIWFCFVIAPLSANSQTAETEQIDEFGRWNAEELQARLGNVLIRLHNDPTITAQFLMSRGESQSIGASQSFFSIARSYFEYHKVDRSRLVPTFCKPQAEQITQIWMIPLSAERKTCPPDVMVFDKTVLFDSVYHPNNYFGPSTRIAELANSSAQITLEMFAELMSSLPNAKGYVFIYGGTNVYRSSESRNRDGTVRDMDSRWDVRNMTVMAVETFKSKGLPRSRVVIREAGYRDSYAEIEMWVVPSGGTIPVVTRSYPKVKAAVKR